MAAKIANHYRKNLAGRIRKQKLNILRLNKHTS